MRRLPLIAIAAVSYAGRADAAAPAPPPPAAATSPARSTAPSGQTSGAHEAAALLERGISLDKTDQLHPAITAFDELVAKFGGSADLETKSIVARAMIAKAASLARLGEDATTTLDQVVTRCGDTEQLQKFAAIALFLKGTLVQEQLGPSPIGANRAVQSFDQLINRFGDAKSADIRRIVARARLAKSEALLNDNNPADAIAGYDDVVRRYQDDQDEVVRAQAALAFVGKATVSSVSGDDSKTFAAINALLQQYGRSTDVSAQDAVAQGLILKAAALRRSAAVAPAAAAYDEVVSRFGTSSDAKLKRDVAGALFAKGVALHFEGQNAGAVSAYDSLIGRFGASSDAAISLIVAQALVNKGVVLRRLGQGDAANAAWRQVIARVGESPVWAFRAQAAMGLLNVGVAQDAAGDRAGAIATYKQVAERFQGASAESLGFVTGATPSLVIAQEAQRRAAAKKPFEVEAYEANGLDPRGVCIANPPQDLACLERAAANNPDNEQAQFFLGVSYIYAKDKEGTLRQLTRLRKMGKFDAAFLFQFVEEGLPGWMNDQRFKEQFEAYKKDFPSD